MVFSWISSRIEFRVYESDGYDISSAVARKLVKVYSPNQRLLKYLPNTIPVINVYAGVPVTNLKNSLTTLCVKLSIKAIKI